MSARNVMEGKTGNAGSPGLTLQLRRFVIAIASSRPATLLVLIAGLSLYMLIRFPNNFPTTSNLSSLLVNAAQQGILVVGMMLLMIAGMFDLSIGSILALAGVVTGVLIADMGVPIWLATALGVGVGALAGALNGLIVTRLGINALITTLATLTIYRGMTQLISGTGVAPIDSSFAKLGQTVFLGLQSPVWIMLVIVVLATIAVAKTRLFRQYYFIGGNPRAAKLSGIKVKSLSFAAFVIMGSLAGVAGVVGAARLNAAVVSAGIGVELSIITAAVLGGASLKGGEGTIIGGVLGVLFIALVQNALIISGVSVFWQSIIIGLVLLIAVSFDRLKTTTGT